MLAVTPLPGAGFMSMLDKLRYILGASAVTAYVFQGQNFLRGLCDVLPLVWGAVTNAPFCSPVI